MELFWSGHVAGSGRARMVLLARVGSQLGWQGWWWLGLFLQGVSYLLIGSPGFFTWWLQDS